MTLRELGRAPAELGERFDSLYLWVESSPLSNDFQLSPLPIIDARVQTGANDRIPTAEIRVGLRPSPRDLYLSPDATTVQRDWQVQLSPTLVMEAREYFGGARRIQLRTARQQRSDDWCVFEGFIDRLGRGWSGSSRSQPRWLRLYCTSTIAAADRCSGQHIIGQWRRSRAAEIAINSGSTSSSETNNLCPVTAVPCMFNPGGRGNRDARFVPLDAPAQGSEQQLGVFADVGRSTRGEPEQWTVAQILRYIQWVAIQPAIAPTSQQTDEPYDIVRTARLDIFGDGVSWTEFPLVHWPIPAGWPNGTSRNGEVGPNLNHLLEQWIERTDDGDDSVLSQAMLRKPANLSIEGMSVLEAFAFVCDEAGLLCYTDHQVTSNGRVLTFLRFAVRGDRCRNADQASAGDTGRMDESRREPNPAQPGPTLGSASSSSRCSARGVYLFVSSDRSGFSFSGTARTDAELAISRDSAMEGEIVEDRSGMANEVSVIGDPIEYEATFVELRPGWTPSPYWDVPSTLPEINDAISGIGSTEFDARFGEGATSNLSFATDGRVWTLNENGQYTAALYARGALVGHRYGSASSWTPFAFRSGINIYHLANRGDNRWSARRRRFLPMIVNAGNGVDDSNHNYRIEGPICVMSFNGGATYYPAKDCGAEVEFDIAQARLTVKGNLKAIRDPGNTVGELYPYPVAYIRGLLRVGVLANIEGDDALFASSIGAGAATGTPFVRVVDRRGHLGRRLRHRDQQGTLPAANSWLAYSAPGAGAGWNTGLSGNNEDKQREARRLAIRMQTDLSVPRFSGRCSIPWLWRDERGPISVGYRIGDEVLGLVTSDASTFISFAPDRDVDLPATRIVGITYSWSEAEQSTALTLEDDAVNVEDVVGAPGVMDRSSQYRGKGGER